LSNPLESINVRSRKTLELLNKRGIVPEFMAFDITEEMLAKAIDIYGEVGGTGNGRFNYGLARKIHGLNLLRLKFSRGAKLRDCKEGMVYLIANPCWPAYLKIGMTIDTEARLASYQTYDPFQRFYIKHWEFCLDRRAAEKELLERCDVHLAQGEWIKYKRSAEIINILRRY